jgi:AcrR family transcriptional regulator
MLGRPYAEWSGMTPKPADRRSARTQTCILAAFRELVFARGYGTVTVSDIVEQANIGRSTFYEHYDNKDDLFRQSLHPIVTVLADAIFEDCDRSRLELVMEHFAEQREFVAAVAAGGTARAVMTKYLQEELETRLARGHKGERTGSLPMRLTAAQIAATQWGLVLAWLSSEGVPAARIATMLASSSKALATAGVPACTRA